ncbi:MAG TPA: Rieske (2Fe-2S) protein [Flexivirga sp.]|uniref:Rieske (2Fe-2S) protein n=1 Tax=Flexivirga sp. TaxID=1962927 RepID=UPI002BE2A916|nr:Rieske (2Fe-2S) protein [Flexivirga sp.]HWC21878.1 Rieske (2Fe-2S) protein [Flexivirga sp.]
MTTSDSNEASNTSHGTQRRVVLRSAGLAGGAVAASAALAACGGSSGSSGSSAGAASAAPSSADAGSAGASGGAGAAGSGKGIAKSKVPVGSGVIDNDLKAVVTQPASGEFKAFSYVCTHQGCPVSQISGDTITCPCHGSEFSTKDGSVKNGPATKPLTPMKATVQGSQVIVS